MAVEATATLSGAAPRPGTGGGRAPVGQGWGWSGAWSLEGWGGRAPGAGRWRGVAPPPGPPQRLGAGPAAVVAAPRLLPRQVRAARRNAARLTHQRLLPTCAARPIKRGPLPARHPPPRLAHRARFNPTEPQPQRRGRESRRGRSRGRKPGRQAEGRGRGRRSADPSAQATGAGKESECAPQPGRQRRRVSLTFVFLPLPENWQALIPSVPAAQGRCPTCLGVSRGAAECEGARELGKDGGHQFFLLEEGVEWVLERSGQRPRWLAGLLGCAPLEFAKKVGVQSPCNQCPPCLAGQGLLFSATISTASGESLIFFFSEPTTPMLSSQSALQMPFLWEDFLQPSSCATTVTSSPQLLGWPSA
jgi:hypothetical protein